MSKTTELRKQLQIILKTVADRVHYEEAPSTESYPYVVYEVSELVYNYGLTTMQLEINVLDYGTSSGVVEQLADLIQDTLHKCYFINEIIQFSIYKGNKIIIKEEDKQIIRRRMNFEIQLHELKGE